MVQLHCRPTANICFKCRYSYSATSATHATSATSANTATNATSANRALAADTADTAVICYCSRSATDVDGGLVRSNDAGGWIIDSEAIYTGNKRTTNGYTSSGITLHKNGALWSKNFRLDTTGEAFFKGTIRGLNLKWFI